MATPLARSAPVAASIREAEAAICVLHSEESRTVKKHWTEGPSVLADATSTAETPPKMVSPAPVPRHLTAREQATVRTIAVLAASLAGETDEIIAIVTDAIEEELRDREDEIAVPGGHSVH
jgi:hypothetical protein